MNYKEFKKTYNGVISEYPNTKELYKGAARFESETIGTCEIIRYEKIGRKWIVTRRESETITAYNYFNIFSAVPFFRALGGSEKVKKAYTIYGNIPFRVASISPDGDTKVVRTIQF